MSQQPLPITQERIEAKVLRIPEAGCWVWMGGTTVRGYGQIESHKRKLYAHRASYEAFIGPIPEGMYVCHACDNVACVNPNHLFLGTQKQNLQDMASKGRSTRGEKNPQAKLTEMDVHVIKKFFFTKSDVTDAEIAKLYGVTRSAITLIRKKERWNHV
jgi:hypothetical protein